MNIQGQTIEKYQGQTIEKYQELRKLCRPHTLLSLITINEGKITFSESFKVVYKSEENLSDYLLDLQRAIKEENYIREIKQK